MLLCSSTIRLIKVMVFPVVMYGCWRRKWQPTPVFLPRESCGWRSLVGCCLWGCTESDTLCMHLWMWELDYKENWTPKNWCFWTVVSEKTLESPLDSKEIQPVHPKGNQSWIFTGRTDAEAKTPILWPHDVKNWLIWKDPDAGKD